MVCNSICVCQNCQVRIANFYSRKAASLQSCTTLCWQFGVEYVSTVFLKLLESLISSISFSTCKWWIYRPRDKNNNQKVHILTTTITNIFLWPLSPQPSLPCSSKQYLTQCHTFFFLFCFPFSDIHWVDHSLFPSSSISFSMTW